MTNNSQNREAPVVHCAQRVLCNIKAKRLWPGIESGLNPLLHVTPFVSALWSSDKRTNAKKIMLKSLKKKASKTNWNNSNMIDQSLEVRKLILICSCNLFVIYLQKWKRLISFHLQQNAFTVQNARIHLNSQNPQNCSVHQRSPPLIFIWKAESKLYIFNTTLE